MNKFKLGKDALILSIMTFLTVLTWVFFEIYRTAKKTIITQVTEKQMLPLKPEIKTATINLLRQKISYTSQELDEIIISGKSTPSGTESASANE